MPRPPIFIDGIPQVEGAIRQPGNPHHFMVARPVGRRLRIWRGDRLIADTTNVLCLIEMSSRAYDPVYYVPPEDVVSAL